VATFVQLCQIAAAEASLAGPESLVAVENQTGDFADIVRWVRSAWVDIQNRNGGLWLWLNRPFTLQTVASQQAYRWDEADDITGVVVQGTPPTAGAIDRFNRWLLEDLVRPPSIYLTSDGVAGERQLVWMPYELFQRLFLFGPQNAQPPTYISVNEQEEIVLGPAPNDIYTVRGRYARGPQVLAASAEVPEMPARYHDVIAWYALRRYAFNQVAPEALANAADQIQRYLRQLELSQLPSMQLAAAME
jgi:hypothetical protein